jgi:hypothetical protein
MELHDALQQIDAIHAHVARSEVFRGYKARAVAVTGLLGLAAASVQPRLVPDPLADAGRYLQLWIGIAAASVAIVGAELLLRYCSSDSPLQREQTRRAVEQFAPCVVAGGAMTWALVAYAPNSLELLPGLWAMVFSLGIFASWRQLPAASLGVGCYYLLAGVVCLGAARGEHALSPWAMAGSFGVGQLLTATVLHFTLERRDAR